MAFHGIFNINHSFGNSDRINRIATDNDRKGVENKMNQLPEEDPDKMDPDSIILKRKPRGTKV